MSRRSTKNLDWDEWLTVRYGKLDGGDPDLLFSGPRGCDRRLLCSAFCDPIPVTDAGESLVAELEARGYDVTTLEFRIQRKKAAP